MNEPPMIIELTEPADLWGRALLPLFGYGARLAHAKNRCWVQVRNPSPDILGQLDLIAASRFRLEDGCWLVPWDGIVATSRLPSDLEWKSLDQQLEIDMPAPAFGGQLAEPKRTPIHLVRGGTERSVSGMITDLDAFKRWVDVASVARLNRLRWACRGVNALIVGSPLPPVDGTLFWQQERVLIPAGFRPDPDFDATTLRTIFRTPESTWLVWESDQMYCHVDDDTLVTVRRASVRQCWTDTFGSALT